MRRHYFLLLAIISMGLLVGFYPMDAPFPSTGKKDKPKISFTFDDGSTKDFPNYPLEKWNKLILQHLQEHKVKAVLFATGSFLSGERGTYVLSSWNDAGHNIANHSFTHPNFNSKKTTLEDFKRELLHNDSVIRRYSHYYPLFRFPYLKEGDTREKRDGFRKFLRECGYKIGHVTIDASDWYIDSRLVRRLRKDSALDISGFRQFYLDHLYARASYYDSLAFQLTKRRINHSLLLHHNVASALFLGDIIQFFKDKGWEVIDADKAYTDSIFELEPETLPAGESLIWALAKQTGKFDHLLRYPAEDSQYEKPTMDALGL